MRLRRGLLAALVLVSSLVLSAGPAAACSCIGLTDAEAFDLATTVFVGTPVAKELTSHGVNDSSTDPATWVFSVDHVYKGDVARQQVVVSERSGASCGLELALDRPAVVFVEDSEANLCGGSRLAVDRPVPDSLAKAGRPPKMPPGCRNRTTSHGGRWPLP